MNQMPTAASQSTAMTVRSGGSALREAFAAIVILVAITIGILVYVFVLGNPNNFEGGDPKNNPLPGNYLGVAYKGGILVPVGIGLLHHHYRHVHRAGYHLSQSQRQNQYGGFRTPDRKPH
jgi:hypothetical protein